MSDFVKYRPHGSRYKVIPGLSINSRELRERVKNRSIIIDQGGKSYSDEIAIDRTLKGSPVDIHRDWLKGNDDISMKNVEVGEVIKRAKKLHDGKAKEG